MFGFRPCYFLNLRVALFCFVLLSNFVAVQRRSTAIHSVFERLSAVFQRDPSLAWKAIQCLHMRTSKII